METITKPAAVAMLAALSIDEKRAIDLVILDSRIRDAQSTVSDLRKEFVAKLPLATEEQVDAVIELTRKEEPMPEGLRPNVDFRLSDAQVARVNTVREERAAFCEANKDALVVPLVMDATQKLRSFKVRQGTKAIVTTLRFEKAMATTKESRGLIAQLAKVTAAMAEPDPAPEPSSDEDDGESEREKNTQ